MTNIVDAELERIEKDLRRQALRLNGVAGLQIKNRALINLSRELVKRLNAVQARLDAVMMEYCPDEMTPEQIANWQANQRPATAEETAVIEFNRGMR